MDKLRVKLNTKFPFFLSVFLVLMGFSHPGFAKKKTIKIKLGTVVPEGTPWADVGLAIRKQIHKRSKKEIKDYKVKVKVYMGGILGGEISVLHKVKAGKLAMFGGSNGAISRFAPEISVIELPYLFNNYKEADAVLDNVLKERVEEIFREKGFIFMFYVENGFRNLASKFPIKTPADLKGKKFRSQEQDIYFNTYKSFGGIPVPIPVPEVLGALQADVVTGFDQTLLYTFATSWYTSIKYYTITKHIYQPGTILCSKKKYESYPPKLQEIITTKWEHMNKFRKKVRDLNPTLIKNMKKAGVNITRLSEAEKKAFKNLVKPVYQDFKKTASLRSREILKSIEKYLGRKN